jgi:hypothetical protein
VTSRAITVQERRCLCPRKESLEGKRADAVWFKRSCAVRWRRENAAESLYEARSANKGRTSKPSGRQVSYWKARCNLRLALAAAAEGRPIDSLTGADAIRTALAALDESLPEKQALAQRDTNQRRRAA